MAAKEESNSLTEYFNKNFSAIKSKDIFVGNLSLFTDQEKLRQFFSTYGEVEDVRIMIHPETGRSRRFGFITFSDEKTVKELLEGGIKLVLDGKELDVKHAFKRSDEEGGLPPVKETKKPFIPKEVFDGMVNRTDTKIFCGGLSQDTTETDIREHFSKFGQIQKINMVMDKETKRSRGFCFIIYTEAAFASLASASRFQTVKGRQVEVKIALPSFKKLDNIPKLNTMWPNFGYWAPPVFSMRHRFTPYATTDMFNFAPIAHHGLYPIHSLFQAAQLMPPPQIIQAGSVYYKLPGNGDKQQ